MSEQEKLVARRGVLFGLIKKRSIQLVLSGGAGKRYTGEKLESKYASLTKARPNPSDDNGDPYLTVTPPFQASEHVELEVFRGWMLPETAAAAGYKVVPGRTGVAAKTGKKVIFAEIPAGRVGLFSATSKMSAGSWSLPAGGTVVGGTCPSANSMAVVARYSSDTQKKASKAVASAAKKITGDSSQPDMIDQQKNICNKCYAAKGNFGVSNTQLWQMARYFWTVESLRDGTFVPQMTAAVKQFQANLPQRKSQGQDPQFFRLHDSGDFFSPDYIEAWGEVASRIPEVHFWAPTRVWMLFHRQLRAAMEKAPNLVIRPSALHFNDPAPVVPGLDAPSTAHKAEVADPFLPAKLGVAQWDCPAYAMGAVKCAGALDLSHAVTPEEKAYVKQSRAIYRKITGDEAPMDCRFCWLNPEHTVSYHAH